MQHHQEIRIKITNKEKRKTKNEGRKNIVQHKCGLFLQLLQLPVLFFIKKENKEGRNHKTSSCAPSKKGSELSVVGQIATEKNATNYNHLFNT